ncbi:MAG TPA: S8 family peptidase [Frankiaceae bacterium]|nr:S8 family peptidase [Frankiaceae bacterium]
MTQTSSHSSIATPATSTSRKTARRGRVVAAATTLAMTAVTLGVAGGTSAQASSATAKTPSGSVIVFKCANPAAAVKAAGGKVIADLPLISGVSATLPKGANLTSCTVTADQSMHVSSQKGKDSLSDPVSTARRTLGLTSKSPDGSGVTVAVVDTGIDNSKDLAGRVIHADVTGSSWNSDRDDYGHGTFVAGLIAGDGAASNGAYAGAAPGARLLDVRVAKDDGSTSLSSVLRGLQAVAWTQKALNIKVLNLSLSSGSPIPFQFDPLSLALDALWSHGIVVVVPAGNDGPGAATISSPGNDPTLLTVGSLDESATASRLDDVVSSFSSRGPAAQGIAKPDLVAPGAHLISLRAPGSVVDEENPGSRVANKYFLGSGTSMSTALTSGVVADLLDARPNLTPDQVKAILASSAYTAAGLTDPAAAGAGGLDLTAALATPAPVIDPAPDTWPAGQDQIWDKFSAALLAGDRAEAYKWWLKLSPEARSWTARSWTQLSPDARSWTIAAWSARSWTGADGTAEEWLARSWAARSWTARSWTARSWTARSWTDDGWLARSWTARSWTDDNFLARSWTARSWTARSWTTLDWS